MTTVLSEQSAERLTVQALELLEGYVNTMKPREEEEKEERAALRSENRRLKEKVANLEALVDGLQARQAAAAPGGRAPSASHCRCLLTPPALPSGVRLRLSNDGQELGCNRVEDESEALQEAPLGQAATPQRV